MDPILTILLVIAGLAVNGAVSWGLAALAYKLRLGYQRIPLTRYEFRMRSLYAGLCMAALNSTGLLLCYLLIGSAGLPPVPVYVVVGLGYAAGGVAGLIWTFALEDLIEGFSVFMLYHLFPFLICIGLSFFGFGPSWYLRLFQA